MKWFCIPVAIGLLFLVGAAQLGPALAAAKGHGTAGYFVPEDYRCIKGQCGWTGKFVLADGQVTRQKAGFMGPHGTFYKGARVAALDTGDYSNVYARQGSRDWITDLVLMVLTATGLGLWVWRVAYPAYVRRRARLDGPPVP